MPKVIPIFLPDDQVSWIMAGPTRELPDNRKLVRCAEEIPTSADRVAIDIATKDFHPFDDSILEQEIPKIVQRLMLGEQLYVGCMGGIGRTGTVLSILAAQHPNFTAAEAIAYIRSIYHPHACETIAQERQVEKIGWR